MVAILNREATSFLETRASKAFVLLFYGSDSGLVAERAREAVQRHTPDIKDPFAVVRLSAENLASDPASLADAVNTIGLWQSARSIWIESGASTSLPVLDSLMLNPVESTQVIIEAAELRRDAPLRQSCEHSRLAAAVECPIELGADLELFISDYLLKAGFSIDPAAKAALCSMLTSGRIATRSELEKLVLYTHGKTMIDLDDVESIVTGGASIGPDRVIDAAFAGDFAELAKSWAQTESLGTDGSMIAGFALRRLLWMRQGNRPPCGLDQSAIRFAVQSISTAIREGRREPRLADSLALRSLWSLARLAKRGIQP